MKIGPVDSTVMMGMFSICDVFWEKDKLNKYICLFLLVGCDAHSSCAFWVTNLYDLDSKYFNYNLNHLQTTTLNHRHQTEILIYKATVVPYSTGVEMIPLSLLFSLLQ